MAEEQKQSPQAAEDMDKGAEEKGDIASGARDAAAVVDAVLDEASADAGEAVDEADDDFAGLREELAQARDLVLRAQADAQNIKRRAEQDVEKARKFALERFCSELLPVVDNLERALDAADSDDEVIKPVAEGVKLTLKSFLDALNKFHIEPVDPAGEPFDPQLHQAMSMVENADAEPNTVLAVMQKGYTLNGRLVRPAMVMVSKAPAAG